MYDDPTKDVINITISGKISPVEMIRTLSGGLIKILIKTTFRILCSTGL
jgi:hypothetical protein